MAVPVLRGSSALIYPFTWTISFLTDVAQMQNGYQQRAVKRAPLVRFEWTYAALSMAQKNTLLTWFNSAKGQMSGSESLAFGGVTYTNLSSDADEFTARESQTMQYDCPLKLSQVIAQDLSPGTAGGAFPPLASGAIGILPYTQGMRFQSIVTATPSGAKFAFAEFAGGLASYPSTGLKFWELAESHVSDADLATRTAHFIANWGRAKQFSFTDEDGTPHTKCHYAMDDLAIRVTGPNDSALTIKIEETNN